MEATANSMVLPRVDLEHQLAGCPGLLVGGLLEVGGVRYRCWLDGVG